MMQLYHKTSLKISKLVTKSYSTSFSIAVSFLNSEMQEAIYSIYGFVRFADEIVDSFQNYDKTLLLNKFEEDYYHALKHGISLNPVLHSFQSVVNKYNIPDALVQAFLHSMKMDLYKTNYEDKADINTYIYGSAEVVGLMCLKVFTNGDGSMYERLVPYAMKLGSAFQKVNFLRDIKDDVYGLNRKYFLELMQGALTEQSKQKIIEDIENDFKTALTGIKQLPGQARVAVYIAYNYYHQLLKKIKNTKADKITCTRIRIPDHRKFWILGRTLIACKLNLL